MDATGLEGATIWTVVIAVIGAITFILGIVGLYKKIPQMKVNTHNRYYKSLTGFGKDPSEEGKPGGTGGPDPSPSPDGDYADFAMGGEHGGRAMHQDLNEVKEHTADQARATFVDAGLGNELLKLLNSVKDFAESIRDLIPKPDLASRRFAKAGYSHPYGTKLSMHKDEAY